MKSVQLEELNQQYAEVGGTSIDLILTRMKLQQRNKILRFIKHRSYHLILRLSNYIQDIDIQENENIRKMYSVKHVSNFFYKEIVTDMLVRN